MKSLTLSQEEIAMRAYQLYLQSGCEHGRDQEHWFQAEKEFGAKFFTPPDGKASTAKKAAKKATAAKPAAKKVAVEKAPAEKPPLKKAVAKK